MKIILVLIVAIAGTFWLFHGRGSRVSPPLRDAVAEAAEQAKTVLTDAPSAAAEVARAQTAKPDPSAFDRIVAGDKLREQPVAAMPTIPKPAGSTAYDRILRGERIVENRRAAAQ